MSPLAQILIPTVAALAAGFIAIGRVVRDWLDR